MRGARDFWSVLVGQEGGNVRGGGHVRPACRHHQARGVGENGGIGVEVRRRKRGTIEGGNVCGGGHVRSACRHQAGGDGE